MNDKELLQKIKNVRTAVKEIYGNVNTITYPMYMVDWLIEQAEKVEQLQQEIASLKEALNESVKTSVALDNELQQAQAKAERYKNHLLCIQKHYGLPSEPTDFVPVTVLHEIQMIVSNALEGES